MKSNKKSSIVLKINFELVDWMDNTTVPNFAEISSTLKVISYFQQTPEIFTKGQTKLVIGWLKRNSVDKFITAKHTAEHHQELLNQDLELTSEFLWTKRINMNH